MLKASWTVYICGRCVMNTIYDYRVHLRVVALERVWRIESKVSHRNHVVIDKFDSDCLNSLWCLKLWLLNKFVYTFGQVMATLTTIHMYLVDLLQTMQEVVTKKLFSHSWKWKWWDDYKQNNFFRSYCFKINFKWVRQQSLLRTVDSTDVWTLNWSLFALLFACLHFKGNSRDTKNSLLFMENG